MEERHQMSPEASPAALVDELHPPRAQLGEGRVEVGHGERDVVETQIKELEESFAEVVTLKAWVSPFPACRTGRDSAQGDIANMIFFEGCQAERLPARSRFGCLR